MTQTIKTQVCIIGASAGGLELAAAAAALKLPVVLIDKGTPGTEADGGGLFATILAGAGKAAVAQRAAAEQGLSHSEAVPDFARIRDRIATKSVALGQSRWEARYAAMGVHIVRAHGRFAGTGVVEAGDCIIKAQTIVVATGATPAIPAIAGLVSVPFLTLATLPVLSRLPAHLAIIGAGSTGLELAQAFARLGSAVTVFDTAAALPGIDRELAGVVVRTLAREGVAIHLNATVNRVDLQGDMTRVCYSVDGQAAHVDASHLLVAAGWQPAIGTLRLDSAGVGSTAAGVTVNAALQSPGNRRVYAMGAAAGWPRAAHVSRYHAGIVLRHALLRQKASADPAHIPQVLLTDPGIASVGLAEAAARQLHAKLNILRFPFAEADRAQLDGQTAGLIKVITTQAGAILGCGIAGAQAAELIAPWTLAVRHGLTIQQMADTVMPCPTLSEVSRRVALSWYAPKLAQAGGSRWLRLLRLRG